MLTCKCGAVFDSPQKFIFHLEYVHRETKYVCPVATCLRTYNRRDVFKKHLVSIHNNNFENSFRHTSVKNDSNYLLSHSDQTPNKRSCLDNQVGNCGESLQSLNYTSEDKINSIKTSFFNLLNRSVTNFVAKLYSNISVPRSVVQDVIDNVSCFLNSGILNYLLELINLMSEDENFLKDEFKNMLCAMENSFANFDSEYKRLKFFESSDSFIKPEQHVICSVPKVNRENSSLSLKNKTYTYISMKRQLKSFLEIPNVLDVIVEYQNLCNKESTVISNFIQSSLWKRFSTHNNLTLPVFLYFDDFEIGNPLGSHSGIYKIGALYYTIATIPPQYASRLENIFVALLFYSRDRSEFGNTEIFTFFINEIKNLETEGIYIEQLKQKVYFSFSLIIGDNLGVHSILGLVESFSANYSCRFCLAHKNDIKHVVSIAEANKNFRKKEDYDKHLEENSYGLKEKCVWNSLKNFHVYENMAVDLMHDLYEGVHRYAMARIILSLIEGKFFSLEDLNFRIKFGTYNQFEKNIPPQIKSEHLKNGCIILSAAEMHCLVRNFRFIVGDLIPDDNQVWALYLILLQLTEIISSTSVTEEKILLLESLIEKHHEMYLNIFHNELKPKFHFLLHYPKLMRLIGPLHHVSSMRFEAKHKDLKAVANSVKCRKNVPLTIATKVQLKSNYRYLSQFGLSDSIDIGPIEVFDLSDIEHNVIIQLNLMSLSQPYYCTSFFAINGIIFKPTQILQHSVVNSIPQFSKILTIIIDKNNQNTCCFLCRLLRTLNFNQHFQAYQVEYVENTLVVPLSNVQTVFPTVLHLTNSGLLVT